MAAVWKEPRWLLFFAFTDANCGFFGVEISMLQDATLCRITVVEITYHGLSQHDLIAVVFVVESTQSRPTSGGCRGRDKSANSKLPARAGVSWIFVGDNNENLKSRLNLATRQRFSNCIDNRLACQQFALFEKLGRSVV